MTRLKLLLLAFKAVKHFGRRVFAVMMKVLVSNQSVCVFGEGGGGAVEGGGAKFDFLLLLVSCGEPAVHSKPEAARLQSVSRKCEKFIANEKKRSESFSWKKRLI